MNYSIKGIYSKYYFSLLKSNTANFDFKVSKERYTFHQPESNYKYKYDSKVNFGQYKSLRLTINDIIDIDPTYILWCVVHLRFFVLSYEILTDSRFTKNQNYHVAVEINNLKYEWIIYINHNKRCSNKLSYKPPFLFLSDIEIYDEIQKLYEEANSIEKSSIGDPEPSFGNDPQLEEIDVLIARYHFYLESYFPNILDYVSQNNIQERHRINDSKK
jgi:hypothetical protein